MRDIPRVSSSCLPKVNVTTCTNSVPTTVQTTTVPMVSDGNPDEAGLDVPKLSSNKKEEMKRRLDELRTEVENSAANDSTFKTMCHGMRDGWVEFSNNFCKGSGAKVDAAICGANTAVGATIGTFVCPGPGTAVGAGVGALTYPTLSLTSSTAGGMITNFDNRNKSRERFKRRLGSLEFQYGNTPEIQQLKKDYKWLKGACMIK